jgi:diguanylate cyclase (GGDEF)-like protein
MYLDIDRFKQINDTHGHAVGDALLKAFAARLMRALRVTDVVARLGGDEFAILLRSLPDPAHAGFVADKILEEVRRAFKVDALRFEVTTSIGIATVTAGAASPDALLKVADESMYRAKQTGRNSWKSSNVAKVLDPAL